MLFRLIIHYFISLCVIAGSLFGSEVDYEQICYGTGTPVAMRGCDCFLPCGCYFNSINEFPESTSYHPYYPEDVIWHHFIEKFLLAKKTSAHSYHGFRNFKQKYNPHLRNFGLLHHYLYVCEEFRRLSIEASNRSIEWYIDDYTRHEPNNQEGLRKKMNLINARTNATCQALASIPAAITPLFKEIIANCPHKENPGNHALHYTKGLVSFFEKDISSSLESIEYLLQSYRLTNQPVIKNILEYQGEVFFEAGLYQEAVAALSELLTIDPDNYAAYFQRAAAYFESGDFERSLSDYLQFKARHEIEVQAHRVSDDFVNTFVDSAISGAKEAMENFFPALYHSAYGLGECLWAFGEHPQSSMHYLATAAYEVSEEIYDYVSNITQDDLDEYRQELVDLYEDFSNLSEGEKGELVGHTIGKYGADIFLGTAVLKSISSFKRLKEANRICNLESLLSDSSKSALKRVALERRASRVAFFRNSKIHWDKQNKHVPGAHNYLEGRSVFTHKDAEGLLKRHAGTGRCVRSELGKKGYQEVVDFQENIGIWKNNKGEFGPTTKGKIHYMKDGQAHIVPTCPTTKVR